MVKIRSQAIVLNDSDDVAMVLADLKMGSRIIINTHNKDAVITLRADIKRFHKFALHDITRGKMIIKYGQSIGRATADIKTGEHVHSHNLVSVRGQTSLKISSQVIPE